jgi:pyridoxamine 5'-phosphate oxidase
MSSLPNDGSPSEKLISARGATAESQFTKANLSRADLLPDPLDQFAAWFRAAHDAGIKQREACTLATAELPSGRVSARIVYIKGLDRPGGFVVYSNWGTSRKAADVASNPRAALTFWWAEMERQVRVEGGVEPVPREEAQRYFDTRGRGSRVGAWASAQSEALRGREELDGRVAEAEARFEGQEEIPVPEFWGGVRVRPETVEFWQGRESRLHDRFRYSREGDSWKIERLSP